MERSISAGELYFEEKEVPTSVPKKKNFFSKIRQKKSTVSASEITSVSDGETSCCNNSSEIITNTTISWKKSAENGQHVWMNSNVSGDFCYVHENECSKIGKKVKCVICKIIAHVNCIKLLPISCRLTFREAGARDYRDGIIPPIYTYHHWVHRKRLNNKCNSCQKSFQNKFPFNSKEVLAIECSWCQVAYHNRQACYGISLMTESCNRGKLSNIIVPPHWIIKLSDKTRTVKSSIRRVPYQCEMDCKFRRKPKLQYQQPKLMTVDSIDLQIVDDDNDGSVPCEIPITANREVSGNADNDEDQDNSRFFLIKSIPASRIKPIIVFVNPRSGGTKGGNLHIKFQSLLNPRQVFDLSQGGPEFGLKLYSRVPNLRILVCGGDGSAGWVMSTIDRLQIPFSPIAVLPLGTGNDLARTLNWGATYTDEPLIRILTCVEEGRVISMDRWSLISKLYDGGNQESRQPMEETEEASIMVESEKACFSGSQNAQIINNESINNLEELEFGKVIMDKLPLDVFNNYFSLGSDAAAALEFHENREANPEKFNNRLYNKLFYVSAGSKNFIKRSFRDLSEYIILECDGVDMSPRLKELKSHVLLFLNIPRYSAGTLPWSPPNESSAYYPQRIDDNFLEVIGLSSSTLAALQVGAHGDRICQCKQATLTTLKVLPVQVDGEPCRLSPSIINISRKNQANLIIKPKCRSTSQIINEHRIACCSKISKCCPFNPMSSNYDISPSRFRENPMDSSSSVTSVKLSILYCTIDEYEMCNPSDVADLKRRMRFIGCITSKMNENLVSVRESIQNLMMRSTNMPQQLHEWLFLDSCTANNFFRIEKSQEMRHFIIDICSNNLYLVDMINSNCSSISTTVYPLDESANMTLFFKDEEENTTLEIQRSLDSNFIDACKIGSIDLANEYLSDGANAYSVDSKGRTCLHLGVKNGTIDFIDFLLNFVDKDVIIICDSKRNETPLHSAVRYRRKEICEKLLKYNVAGLSIRNIDQMTPSEMAENFGDTELCSFLKSKVNIV